MTCCFVRGIEINCVRVELSFFQVVLSTDVVFVFVVVVEIDSVFGCGPQIVWFVC